MDTVLNLFFANFIYVQSLKSDVILQDSTNLNGGWDLKLSDAMFITFTLDYSLLENDYDSRSLTGNEY
jgi:hypothetical protein